MKKCFALVLIICLCLPNSLSLAEPPPVFTVTAPNLRERLTTSGVALTAAQNRLRRAKLNVDAARGRLFPSLNLGVIAGTLANPSFVLASVSYVLPFLIPSNWFDLKQAKAMQEAEKFAFSITELNLLASTYALSLNIENDLKAQQLLQADLEDGRRLERFVRKSYEIGSATQADVLRAESHVSSLQIKAAQVAELLIDEMAELKEVLDLPQTAQLEFSTLAPSNPHLDQKPTEQLISAALTLSPEKKQTEKLLESARIAKKSKMWSFISGASAGNSARGLSPNEWASFAFSKQQVQGSFSFGLDYFPNLNIAQTEIDDLKLRLTEIDEEMNKIITSMIGRLEQIQIRYGESVKAEKMFLSIYQDDFERYQLGALSLTDLIESNAKYRQSTFERLRAETDLHLIWLSAHRILISEEFAQLKGCEALPRITLPKRRWNGRVEEPALCDPKATSIRFTGAAQD